MSHTTYNNDNAHLFHRLTKALTKCRKTHFPGRPLLWSTSFKSIIGPQKACSFRTKLCLFPCYEKEQQAPYCCHSQWSIWGSGGHPWAQGVPSSSPRGYQELRAGLPGYGVGSPGTHHQPHVSSFSCSEHDYLLVWLIPGCSSLISQSAEWRKGFSQCKTNVLFLPSPKVSFCTLNTLLVERGRKAMTF